MIRRKQLSCRWLLIYWAHPRFMVWKYLLGRTPTPAERVEWTNLAATHGNQHDENLINNLVQENN